jgi:hypothetical protein
LINVLRRFLLFRRKTSIRIFSPLALASSCQRYIGWRAGTTTRRLPKPASSPQAGIKNWPFEAVNFVNFGPYWRTNGLLTRKSYTVKKRTFQRKHTREFSIIEQVPLHAMYLELVLIIIIKSYTVKKRTFQRKHTRESSILEQVPLHAMYLELVLSTEHAFNYDQTMNSRTRMQAYGEHA